MMRLPSAQEMEAYIRQSAAQRGIDPDAAVRVARTEGLKDGTWQSNIVKNGKREPSYGPFQLFMGGGLGNDMQRRTGIDPSNPANWKQGIDFALDHASKNGWGAWYGARDNGIPNNYGIGGRPAGKPVTYRDTTPPQPGLGSPMVPQMAPQPSVAPSQQGPAPNPFMAQTPPMTPQERMARALSDFQMPNFTPQAVELPQTNFAIQAAPPGTLNPTPPQGEDQKMALLMQLLQGA